MGLTKIQTNAIADDAVTADQLANAINTERTANTAKTSLEDNAVTLAKMAGGTDGQIITYDASGDPVAVGPGTDGQVLTSTGAGSPPAFETLPTSGATLSGSTDNTVVTVTGSNAMAGEANLTFDGTKLGIGTDTHWLDKVTIKNNVSAGTHNWMLHLLNGTHAGDSRAGIAFQGNNATTVETWDGAGIYGANDGATGACNLHLGKVVNGSFTEELKVGADGQVTITDGDLVIGTAGHGIDFSATSDASGKTSELLDDYEEGTYTAQIEAGFKGTTTYTHQNGFYTKVGRVVHFDFAIQFNSATSDGTQIKINLPFSSVSGTGTISGGGNLTWYNQNWVNFASHTPAIYIDGGDAIAELYAFQYAMTANDDVSQNTTWIKGNGTFRTA